MTSRGAARTSRAVGVYLVLVVFAVLFLVPLAWLMSIALKLPSELEAFPPHLLPQTLHWSNFRDALNAVPFLGYARNTLLLSILSATLTTLSSAAVGFGLARLPARGRSTVFAVMVGTLMIPPVITLIPTYVIFAKVGLLDTYWPWVMWGLSGSSFLAFLFRQFFAALPPQLEDAAIVDGCGYGRIFWRIFLPLSKPVLATSFVLQFVAVWGDWLLPALLLSNDRTTLSVAVGSFYTNAYNAPEYTLIAAAAIMYSLPVLVLFLGLQRLFIRGIATTGIQ